jgi:hypothetical protein
VGVIDGFDATWSQARQTYGEGTPTTGRGVALVAVAILALLSSCGQSTGPRAETETETSGAKKASWPELLRDFRFHWSSEPGIDVTVGPAMVARAYVESYDTAWFTLNMENAYPGFLEATPENATPGSAVPNQLTNIRPLGPGVTKTAKDARPHFGYQVLHFLTLDQTEQGYSAIVCSGEYAHFVESRTQPGKFVSIGVSDETAQPLQPGASGVFPHRVDFVADGRPADRSPGPEISTPQSGPEPAPTDDVFGSWFFTGSSTSGWGPPTGPGAEAFPSPELQQRCENAMPQNAEQRRAMMTGFKDSPPEAGNAMPGWPAFTS